MYLHFPHPRNFLLAVGGETIYNYFHLSLQLSDPKIIGSHKKSRAPRSQPHFWTSKVFANDDHNTSSPILNRPQPWSVLPGAGHGKKKGRKYAAADDRPYLAATGGHSRSIPRSLETLRVSGSDAIDDPYGMRKNEHTPGDWKRNLLVRVSPSTKKIFP